MGSFAQSPIAIPQGKIAVFRTGDGQLAHGVGNGVGQNFTFVDVYDITGSNQSTPLFTYAFPTNVLWLNGHAGTEGQAISRSADRSLTIAFADGYTGPMNYSNGTPSSAIITNGGTIIQAAFPRGFGLLDPISGTNFTTLYSGYDWFGLPNAGQPGGVTQNNPTGIATVDGQVFWGSGNVTPVGSTLASGVQCCNTASNFTMIQTKARQHGLFRQLQSQRRRRNSHHQWRSLHHRHQQKGRRHHH